MSRIVVYLETSEEALSEGGYLAHVPDMPGCTARGATKEEALRTVRRAIAEHAERLRAHGFPAPPLDEEVELDVTETDETTLPTDYRPLADADLADLAAQARISREALLELLLTLSPEELHWRAGEEEWQLRWIVGHVASADLWYASRMEDGAVSELVWRLQTTRDILLQRLAELPTDQRDRVTEHDGEPWTPRKAARRMLEHEYEHLQQLREALEACRRPTGR